MNENEVRAQTKAIVSAYQDISKRNMQSISISDFLLLRNQAVAEIDRGLAGPNIADMKPVDDESINNEVKPDTDTFYQLQNRKKAKIITENRPNKDADNSDDLLAERESEGNKSRFEILKEIKDEWNE